MRESVRDVHEAFEVWCSRQVLTPDIALHVHHTLGYLRMAEQQPLTPGCRAKLAEHVEAIRLSR